MESLEARIEEEIKTTRDNTLRVARPTPDYSNLNPFFDSNSPSIKEADRIVTRVAPIKTDKPLKNGEAVNLALRTII